MRLSALFALLLLLGFVGFCGLLLVRQFFPDSNAQPSDDPAPAEPMKFSIPRPPSRNPSSEKQERGSIHGLAWLPPGKNTGAPDRMVVPAAGWPVVLYSPGWDGGSLRNRSLFSALAGAGFVVIAVEPDFTGGPPEAFDFSSAESTRRFYSSASAELEKRTRDLLHVADSLPELRAGVLADGKFAARINPEWVGVAGFSFGGAVAAEALRRDPRLRAGADLDGTLFGEAATAGAQQPFLFVTDALLAPSPEALASANDAERRLAEFFAKSRDDIRSWLATHGGWLARWTTAQHGDFAPPTGGRGNNRQILAQVDSLVADFFRQAYHDRLNEFPSGGIPPWPDFEFSHHPAHSE